MTKDATEVADRLHSTAIHLLRQVRRQDAATGLSASRLSALSVVVFAGPLSLGDLAAAEQVSPSTMSRVVSGLVDDGLVRRTADPRDARAVTLKATAKGNRVLQQGRRRRVAQLAAGLAALTAKELETVDAAVTAVQKALAGSLDPRPTRRT